MDNRIEDIAAKLGEIERVRNSKALLYFTGSKKPIEQFGTIIASDTLAFFKTILFSIGKVNKITLALNTNGGSLDAPWPIVNLIREYCRDFEVIVLDKALSAGTLLSLGADRIVMLPHSLLSPIDPTANIKVGTKENPRNLEVEDIFGYLDFVKNKIGIAEQSGLAEVMKELTEEVSPTIIGSVNRTHSLIRKLAKNLLHLHPKHLSEKQCKEIIDNLTQELYSHSHLINRREARELVGFGKLIEFANKSTEAVSIALFDATSALLELDTEFDPPAILREADSKEITIYRAVLMNIDIKYAFTTDVKILKAPDQAGALKINVLLANERWTKSST